MTYESMGASLSWKKKLLFSGVFIQENLLHAVFDRYNDMSCKQWLLLSVCRAFDEPPDLSTVAKAMGCSRQNVKQLARCLEQEGYVTLERAGGDARRLCIRFTENGERFSEENQERGELVHQVVFGEFTEEEIEAYFALSVKMMRGIKHLEEFYRQKG